MVVFGGWLKSFVKRIKGEKPHLVEIFNDYQVEVESEYTCSSRSGKVYGKRVATYRIIPKAKPKTITVDDLIEYVNNLTMHHPKERFKLAERKIGKRTLYVITKDSVDSNKPTVPIYFDLDKQKFYIDKESTKNPKITNYIIMVTLGQLGVSQSKYVRSELIRNGRN